MFKVKYKFINEQEIVIKEFDNFLDALKFQGDIITMYKNKLEYCIYE